MNHIRLLWNGLVLGGGMQCGKSESGFGSVGSLQNGRLLVLGTFHHVANCYNVML